MQVGSVGDRAEPGHKATPGGDGIPAPHLNVLAGEDEGGHDR